VADTLEIHIVSDSSGDTAARVARAAMPCLAEAWRRVDGGFPVDARGRAAVRAYLVSLYAMIPFVGLLLGPIAFLLGLGALVRGRRDSDFKGTSLCKTAMLIGFLLTVTQWGGLALMISGLRGD
jgi:hypothetical protein